MSWKARLRLLPIAAALGSLLVLIGMAPASAVGPLGKTSKTISFVSASYSVYEGVEPTVTIALARSSSVGKATVTFSTSDGTAVAGTDYVDANYKVTFQAGFTAASATVTILPNASAVNTTPKTVNLSLSKAGGWSITTSTATLLIYEDPLPTTPTGVAYHVPNTSEIDITWTAGAINGTADNSFYEVERSENGSTYDQLGAQPAPVTEFIDDGTVLAWTGGNTYYYRVVAMNAEGTRSAYSTAVQVIAPQELITNGSFELFAGSLSGWQPDLPTGFTALATVLQRHAGDHSATIFSSYTAGDGSISQNFTVPNTTESASLTYWLYLEGGGFNSGDTVLVKVHDVVKNSDLTSRSIATPTYQWTQGVAIDLSSAKGDEVTITFTLHAASGNFFPEVYIDGVTAPLGLVP